MSVTIQARTRRISKPIKKGNLNANGSEQTVVEAMGIGMVDGYLDLAAMQLGDVIQIKQYVKVEGSYRLYAGESYSGVQITPVLYCPKKTVDTGMKITLQQTAGTFKRFPHAFYRED